MNFGRQNNLHRRAVRPDGRFTREVRRRGATRATLLDVANGTPARPPSLLARLVARLLRRR